jgi:predicted transcriptional regulator
MNQTDDRILELLAESDLVLSPSVLAVNLDYTRNWISRRVSRLHDEGLVEKVDGSYYRITELGRDYLEGRISAEELE